ncbi:MAG: ATP-binding cassette domain-containing protein [Rhodospirillaceae bacterium]|nr:ATP-binding cassette domain-containing protein [Rhodospirillales bacterium]
MLKIDGLCRPGLQPASFTLAAGECVVVQGASGAGKSLLLRAIADLDPNQGRVSLDGHDRAEMAATAWRARVGYVPAEPGWWADRVDAHFLNWNDSLARRLNLPDGMGTAMVVQLSTGERQRLALLRALERQPHVLLLDEPTAALDATATALVEELLAERRAGGMAQLWVSHDADQAARLGGRRLVVEHGRVREEGA